jgi:hypothetical protein
MMLRSSPGAQEQRHDVSPQRQHTPPSSSTARVAVFSTILLTIALTGACGTTTASVRTGAASGSSATGSAGGGPGIGAATGIEHCKADRLRFTVLGTNGAAGTIADAVQVTNMGRASCWTYGYVGLTIIDRSGHRLPTTTIRGTLTAIVPNTPERVTLPVGAWAWFALAYHDSAPASCANPPIAGAQLAIIAPDTTQAHDLTLRTDAACGQISVSPILPASTWQRADWARP